MSNTFLIEYIWYKYVLKKYVLLSYISICLTHFCLNISSTNLTIPQLQFVFSSLLHILACLKIKGILKHMSPFNSNRDFSEFSALWHITPPHTQDHVVNLPGHQVQSCPQTGGRKKTCLTFNEYIYITRALTKHWFDYSDIWTNCFQPAIPSGSNVYYEQDDWSHNNNNNQHHNETYLICAIRCMIYVINIWLRPYHKT